MVAALEAASVAVAVLVEAVGQVGIQGPLEQRQRLVG